MVLSDSDSLGFNEKGLTALLPHSSSVVSTGGSLGFSISDSSLILSAVLAEAVVVAGKPIGFLRPEERPMVPPVVPVYDGGGPMAPGL